jgi:DNA-binding NtrC family response regulator
MKQTRRVRVLVVADAINALADLLAVLDGECEVALAAGSQEALEELERFQPLVVFCDLRMQGGDRLGKTARARGNTAHFVNLTEFSSEEAATASMKAGADYVLPQPVRIDSALLVLQRILDADALQREVAMLRERIDRRVSVGNALGKQSAS